MSLNEIKIINQVLADMQAKDINQLDISRISNFADIMILATGTSNRHVKAIANNLVKILKNHNLDPLSISGEQYGEWILIDLGNIVLHIMLENTRNFYDLESLWDPYHGYPAVVNA